MHLANKCGLRNVGITTVTRGDWGELLQSLFSLIGIASSIEWHSHNAISRAPERRYSCKALRIIRL
jgi:hypothetical protein